MNEKNNAIVQVFIPASGWEQESHLNWQNNEVIKLSTFLTKHYAKKTNASYFLITKAKIFFKHPTWERFQLFEDVWINNFNNILYLDTDVFPWPDSPNIFNYIDNKSFNTSVHCMGKKLNGVPSFNAGVFVLNKSCAIEMRKYFKKNLWVEKFKTDPDWEDSKELNEIAQKTEINHYRLSPAWNIKNSPDAYFTHMWGVTKKNDPDAPAILKARQCIKNLDVT
jgi:hypothetical protein